MFSLMGNCISSAKKRRQPKKPVTLALLGVDNAGKTTASFAFSGEPLDPDVAPTIGFRGNVKFPFDIYDVTLFDIGGGKNIRPVWKNYFPEVYGVIFMVDSSTADRMDEARETLRDSLEHPNISGKPVLLLANKQDKPDALDEVDICEQLNLESVVNANKCPCRIDVCTAIKGTGKKMDPHLKEGMRWLLSMIEKDWEELKARVDEDIKIMKEREKAEAAARRERVRKMREERDREEEEERQRLGIEKKPDSDDDDIVAGDPFKPLDINELKKKEETLKAEKKRRKELEATAKKDDSNTLQNGNSEKIFSARTLPPLEPLGTPFLEASAEGDKKKKKKKRTPRDSDTEVDRSTKRPADEMINDKNDNKDVSHHDPQSYPGMSKGHSVMTVSNIQVSTHDDFPSRQMLAAGITRVPKPLDGGDGAEDPDTNETPRTRKLKKKRLRQLGASLSNVNGQGRSPRNGGDGSGGDGGDLSSPPRPVSHLKSLDGGEDVDDDEEEEDTESEVEEEIAIPIESMTDMPDKKKTKPSVKKNKLGPLDEKYQLAPLGVIGGNKESIEPREKPSEKSGRHSRHSQMHSNVSIDSDAMGSRTWGMAEDLPAVADDAVAFRQPNFKDEDDIIL